MQKVYPQRQFSGIFRGKLFGIIQTTTQPTCRWYEWGVGVGAEGSRFCGAFCRLNLNKGFDLYRILYDAKEKENANDDSFLEMTCEYPAAPRRQSPHPPLKYS